jgi:hypothetical protein
MHLPAETKKVRKSRIMSNCDCATANTDQQQDECCCGPAAKALIRYQRVPAIGEIDTPVGSFPVIPTKWSWRDRLGALSVRFGYGRMDYAIAPGIYAIGNPSTASPVFVSANYKLSFDVLRRSLSGIDCWVLAIDTRGVNVWCAAGKGTFGSSEVIRMVQESELAHIVSHRELILPQLGAPGVTAHLVEKHTGFKVIYGPVRATDINAFLAAGKTATPRMRQVTFGLADRLIVSLMEFSEAAKKGVFISLILWLLFSFGPAGFQLSFGWHRAAYVIEGLWVAILAGSLFTAALLPYLPGRMFSLKGAVAGAVSLTAFSLFYARYARPPLALVPALSLILLGTALSSYIAMNFTGGSTFTSLSGVKKEISRSLPFIIGSVALSGLLQILCLLNIL